MLVYNLDTSINDPPMAPHDLWPTVRVLSPLHWPLTHPWALKASHCLWALSSLGLCLKPMPFLQLCQVPPSRLRWKSLSSMKLPRSSPCPKTGSKQCAPGPAGLDFVFPGKRRVVSRCSSVKRGGSWNSSMGLPDTAGLDFWPGHLLSSHAFCSHVLWPRSCYLGSWGRFIGPSPTST